MFKKILIANRGEIACRVMRTARELGYRSVAVFSEADTDAPHVALADEAICIGPAAAAQSYLNVAAILDAARRTGADAIHPGYGFLSENAHFAQACLDAGIVFIGPSPQAIRVMGDKAGAKHEMMRAGVPTAPGYLGADQNEAALIAEGGRLGFPLLVKAVSGGGGRGMRLVHRADELPQAIASARREAQSAFADGTLMLERLIENGRHIEIQVFADAHGNAVYIGERDCTAQRRRQKVIEESPSPVVTPAMREAMGRDAVKAALAIGYCGAGTIEYIVDQDLNHYFLEMNTRLQVEHPVTEMISGLDLVEWQLRVADGQPLPLSQDRIRLSGHAIEARLYAEDPYAGFAPQTGRIAWWRPASALRPGVRIDDGIAEGGEVTPHYDPMVAKLIVHGRDRDDAIRRLMATLDDAPLLGLRHNARFLRDLVDHPRFRTGSMTTTLIDQWQADGEAILHRPVAPEEAWLIAAAAFATRRAHARGDTLSGPPLRSASVNAYDLPLVCEGQRQAPRIDVKPDGRIGIRLSAHAAAVHMRVLSHGVAASEQAPWQARDQVHCFPSVQASPPKHALRGGELRYEVDGVRRRVMAAWCDDDLHIVMQAATFVFTEVSPWPDQADAQDPSRVLAPVAGTVAQVLVQPGHAVGEGQPLLSIEAMKMEMWLSAQRAGIVQAVAVKPGDQVQAKALLACIDISTAVATSDTSDPRAQ